MPDAPGLSGRWLGRYDYDGMAMEPVSFEAELTESSGSLGGRIFEPNTFRDDRGATLEARIEGHCSGDEVRFVKVYLGFDQGGDPVYAGTVDAARKRIEGRWSFAGLPGVSGRFVMMRKPRAAIAREQLAVEGVEI